LSKKYFCRDLHFRANVALVEHARHGVGRNITLSIHRQPTPNPRRLLILELENQGKAQKTALAGFAWEVESAK